MKAFPLVSIFTAVALLSPDWCMATSVGVSTVEQPVNLGARSDPTRIPLGPVGVISNHNYGIHRMIGEARPCPSGAMRWEGGSELDQNLASVFGISVEAEDPTQITAFPVTLRMSSWKPPGYSPYTKEQVLAATLWCLLRSTGGTPERPLEVVVVAKGAEDKPLEARYSGKYVTRPGKDGREVPPVKVPGTLIEEDAKGVAWVRFPEVTKAATAAPPAYGLIILEADGDGDPGWHLLPVWGNGDDDHEFLEINNRSAIMCYSSYHSRGLREANSFLAEGGSMVFKSDSGDKFDSVDLSYPRVRQETLAANILALVMSARPTDAHPLKISFMAEEHDLARYPAFRSAPGWKETRMDGNLNHRFMLECEFAWDANKLQLTKGSVPCVVLASRRWIIPDPSQQDPPAGQEKRIAMAVYQQIKDRLHDGSLLPESNIAKDGLPETGLRRQMAIAGYYEALAANSNGDQLPEFPMDDPVHLGIPEFDQPHRTGWVTGMNRAQAIAIEVRKAMEEEVEQKEKDVAR